MAAPCNRILVAPDNGKHDAHAARKLGVMVLGAPRWILEQRQRGVERGDFAIT